MDIFKMMKDLAGAKGRFAELQKQLKDRIFTEEYEGVKISINGLLDITDIKISESALKSGQLKLESAIRDCLQRVNRSAKESMEKEFKDSFGFPFSGLSS